MVFNAASTAVNKYNDVLSTMMELGSGEVFNRDDILQQTLATNKLSESTYKYMLSIGVTSTAEMTFTQKLRLSTIALWEQAAAWAASPLGMATIAAVSIFAIVKAVDWLTVSVEESREALAKLGEEYKENESKLKELNSELETTVDRITELEGKDSLTFTEAEELQNLKKQNNELEREIALLETIQRIKSQERNATFVDTMEKDLANAKEHLRSHDYSSSNYSAIYTDTKKYGKGRSVRTMSEMDLINSALMRRAEIIEALSGELTEKERTRLESLQYEIDNYLTEKLTELNNDVDSSGVRYISNPTTEDEKAVNTWLSFIDDFNDKMMIAMGTTGAKENAVNRLILGDYAEVTKDLQLLGEQGAVTADHLADPKYADFINKCIELGIISDNSADSLGFLALAFNTVADAADGASSSTQYASKQLQTEIDTINDGIDSMQSRLSTLSGALTKLQDGSLGVNDVIDLLQQFPELATYVDLTADGFGNLEQGLRDLIKASPDELIESLQKFKGTKDLTEEQKNQIDNLCAALSDLPTDAIKDVTGEFGRLADQIRAATDAQTELEKKLAEDDYDKGYEGRVSAYEGLQETIKAGEFGSKAYAAYKNYFGLEDKDSSGVKKWIKDNKKYFTEGTDGVLKFMKTVEQLGEVDASFKEIATFDSSTGAFWYDINRLSDFAKELDWTEQMVQDFIYKYRMYCEEWESRSAQDNLTEFTEKGFIFSIGNDTFASIEKLMDYTGLTRDEVKGLISDINNLNNADILTELEELGAGGGVDLTLRPAIDTSELANKGWDVAAGEIATVFTNTFTNEAGDVAVNFTPIIADANGNYIGTLSEDELISYAEGVIAGTREDDLKLQIGSEFVGENAIQQAEDAANRIHELHESLQSSEGIQLIGEDQISITQATVDNLLAAGATADQVKSLLLELNGQDNVTIEAGIELEGQSVEELISDVTGDGTETVSIDIAMTVNDEEVIATVTTTAEQIKAILGEDWAAKISADSADAEARIDAVNKLLTGLPKDTLVTVSDSTAGVRSSLSSVQSYLQYIRKNANQTITITYRENGSPIRANASGTRRATRGLSLLGDEYSPDGSPKPELVVSNGRAYLAGQNGPEIGYLNEGDIVYNATETKRILRGNLLHSSIQAHAGGTANGLVGNGGFSGGNHNFSGSAPDSNSKNKKKKESWFEREYKDHQHLLAMDQESVDEYLKWLEEAYQKAYEEGIIDLDEYYQYQEEVYQGIQDQFRDHINDIDHEISMLEAGVGNSDEIINLSLQAMKDIEDELAAARAAGLDENSDYIQWLEQQWMSYSENVTSMRERAEAEAQSSIDNLVEYRIDMLKQEIQDQKDALSEQLDDLQDFYDKQRKMLQDQYDEEKYLEEQKEKRKSVTDIRSELAMLENDNSAWAQKRKLELLAELAEAEKDLNSFERDHALDVTLGVLDEQQAAQEAQIQAQMDALDEKLNDPHALFNQALEDIKNNTSDLYQQFIDYNRKHGTGNDQDIADMWEEAHIADLEYQDTHNGEHKDGIEIGNYTGYVAPETPAPKASDTQPDPKPEPEEPQLTAEIKEKVAAAIWNGKYGWGSGSTRAKRLIEVFGANNGIQDLVSQGVGKSGVSLTDEYTYKNMRKKFKGYKSGTDNATPGWHKLFEGDLDEYVFTSSDGNRYRMFSGLGDKVLNGEATDFLYDFANGGGTVLTNMLADLLGRTRFGNVDKPIQAVEIYSGDIIVQGNASERTVSEIRRAQRDNLEFVLKELNRLNK